MKKAKHKFSRFLYKFHRYTGLVVGIILLMLAVTGIALNHTGALNLEKNYVQSTLILDWYGIDTPKLHNSYSIKNHRVTQANEQIYLDASPLFKTSKTLLGATSNDSFIALAFSDSIRLLTLDGETIEQINKTAIQKIAVQAEDRIYIQSQGQVYYSDDALLSWQLATQEPADWSIPSPLPVELEKQLNQSLRDNILPYERIVLDMHSGRFFGKYGVYIIDLAGIFCILLVISGTWIWLKHSLKRKRKSRTKN